MNYNEKLFRALAAKSKEEADRMLAELVKDAQKQNALLNAGEAQAIQLSNLGYFMGYLGDEDRAHALAMWPEVQHPIFGRWEQPINPEDAFQAGVVVGQAAREDPTKLPAAIEAARELIKRGTPQS